MSKPRETPRLKAYYSLAEYAVLVGENLHTVRSQAARGTLKTGRIGKKHVVFLSQLASQNPELLASIQIKSRLENVSRG